MIGYNCNTHTKNNKYLKILSFSFLIPINPIARKKKKTKKNSECKKKKKGASNQFRKKTFSVK